MRKPPLEVSVSSPNASFHFLILRLSRILIKFHFHDDFLSRGWELGTAIINLEMISLLSSVIDGDFLGLPILVLLCFLFYYTTDSRGFQKKFNRLDELINQLTFDDVDPFTGGR